MSNTYGTRVCSWGVSGSYTGMVIQSYDINNKPLIDLEVTNETGAICFNVIDDVQKELSIDAVAETGSTAPTVGGTFVYGGTTYIVKESSTKGTNKDTLKYAVKCVKYAGF